MKKTFLLLTGFMLYCSLLNAQYFSGDTKPVSFGARAGLQFANVSQSSDGVEVSYSSLMSPSIGFFAEIKLSDKMVFQPELLYNRFGTKYTYNVPDLGIPGFPTSGEIKLNLDYLSMPIFVKSRIGESKLHLYGGPQIGYLLGSSASMGGTTVTGETDELKKLDLGGAFGAEYQLSDNFGATFRYYTGFSNIAKPADGETGTMKNKAFGISISYRF